MTARDDAATRQDGARRGDDGATVRTHSIRQCFECGRVFNMMDEDDAEEWFYGHDCEA